MCSWNGSSPGWGAGPAVDALRTIPTARKLYAVLERLAEQRRAVPDDGLISGLLAANEDGDSLSDDEVIAMIFLLMLAGHDTTANLIGSSAVALIEHPEQAARLGDEPALTASAVEELLRFTTPVPCGTARTLLDEVEIGGTTMPKGSKVMGMIISANRDEAVFERPDDLDLGRDPNRHLTFAFGKHFCLGNQLARLEGQIAIGALARRFPHDAAGRAACSAPVQARAGPTWFPGAARHAAVAGRARRRYLRRLVSHWSRLK